MDVDSNNDISFVFHSTTDAPSQIISETDISFGSSVSDTKKDDMILYNIIGLENPSIIGRDLSGSNVRHLDNLQGIDFSGSNLSYIDFKSKNLTGCNFSFTNLFHTDFSGATLTNCIFTGASINMTNFTQTIGLSTLTFGVDNTNSKIVLEDHPTATLPTNVSFTADFAVGMGNTGRITVSEIAKGLVQLLCLMKQYRRLFLEEQSHLIFSFIDTTDLDKNNITVNIVTTPTKGVFNKTTFGYHEFGKFNTNIGSSGSENIQWYLNTPNGNTNNATITFEFDTSVVKNNAVIQNVDLQVEANNTIDIVLTGLNVEFFEITQAPTNGSIILNEIKRKIRLESTRIRSTDTITYTAFSTFGVTELFKYRAFGKSNLYSNNRNINISIIEEVMDQNDKVAVDNAVQNVLLSVLSDVNTGVTPQVNVGNALTNIGGVSKEKKKQLLLHLFQIFSAHFQV